MKLFFLVIFAFSILVNSALAEKEFGNSFSKPAEIEADSMGYDKVKSLVTASGNVEVVQGGRILLADKVTYDQQNNLVEAEGNIKLTEPTGNVFYANKISLKDDLKKGVIDHFRAKFTDDSRMSADVAKRVDETILVMEKAAYSPCPLCEEDPTKAPLWQVRANKATIDDEKQRVTYNHAFFDVRGVPVLYTPYLSHPTPDAKRKSGFLIPKYSTDKIFGTTVKVPYYYNIAPNKDLTLSPTFTSNEGNILSGEYRHLLPNGKYTLEASITNPDRVDVAGNTIDGDEVRGHIEGAGDFVINEIWGWGFDGKRSTDDTYLRRYNFGDEDVLTSKVFATAIDGRNFMNVEAITFQGLKANDDPGATPFIMPSVNAHWESNAGYKGSRWKVDGNVLALRRDEGVSSNRLSLKGGWHIPYITKTGQVFEFNTSLRGDGYFVDDVPEDATNANSRKLDGFASRFIPQAELKWSLPMVRKKMFLEPTAKFIISPYGGNSNKIHNEDSQDIEFSDENLFDANHFTGFDRVESGPRVNYGLRGGIYDAYKGDINFLVGQNYRTREDSNFSSSSGLDSNFSDYVGRIAYESENNLSLAYKFRVDQESFSFNRNAVTVGLDLSPVKLNVDYLSVDDNFDITTNNVDGNRELVLANAAIDITEKWELSGGGHRNLESGEWVSTKANVIYKGDCVDVRLAWFKEFTRDRDIRPNTTLSLQISLKNLGY